MSRTEEEKFLQDLHDLIYAAMDELPLRKIMDGLEGEVYRIKKILDD
jgi:hypothetical protein